MRMACICLLTGGMLLPVYSAFGQRADADQYGAVTNAPVVCNDGNLLIGVARAFRGQRDLIFNTDSWSIQGWDYVAPGKCQAIGEPREYHSGNLINRSYSLTLLAFAFKDSAGVWGSIRVPDTTDGIFTTSNEQICVAWDNFQRSHASSQGGPGSNCVTSGDFLIPASLEYSADTHYGYYGGQMTYTNTRDYLHVKVDSSERARPMRSQSSSTTPSSVAPAQSAASSGDSFGDQVLKAFAQAVVDAGKKPAPKSDPAASEAESQADLLRWVQQDVTEYIAASATGFDAYKSGSGVSSSGLRMWDSKVKPLAAKGCWVVQGDTTATFSCLLSTGGDLNALRSYYTQLTGDVAVSLPPGWKADETQPFGGDLPSKAFHASSGAHGEVWIGRAASDGNYELHYQLVSAPLAPQPASSRPDPVDDPIGSGGFIKPPSKRP
jgi:hypothetical protein